LAEIFGFLKRTGRKKKNEAYICSFRDAFLDEYFSAMDTEIARSIPLYEAVIGLRRACKCLRVQDEAGWEEKLRRLVRQAAVSLTSIERIPETIDLSEVVAIYERSPGSA
jgi:hypothetical protein